MIALKKTNFVYRAKRIISKIIWRPFALLTVPLFAVDSPINLTVRYFLLQSGKFGSFIVTGIDQSSFNIALVDSNH